MQAFHVGLPTVTRTASPPTCSLCVFWPRVNLLFLSASSLGLGAGGDISGRLLPSLLVPYLLDLLLSTFLPSGNALYPCSFLLFPTVSSVSLPYSCTIWTVPCAYAFPACIIPREDFILITYRVAFF